jgi:hypothetical protein
MEINSLDKSVTIVLESAGFVTKNGTYVKGLKTADKGKEIFEVSLHHGKILDEIDLIYETPGTLEGIPGHPCIYFKKMEKISIEPIKKLRKDIWNIGRAPILWIITPDYSFIYDAFARPEEDETEKTHILDTLKITAKGLEGVSKYKRQLFDTSKFWESETGKRVSTKYRVENSLLDDLWETEKILTKIIDEKERLSVEISHSLIGRCIFLSYLWDRGVITSDFLKNKFGYSDIKQLFSDKDALYLFFQWLRDTFNGNLFPISNEEKLTVKEIHLKVLKKFFEGTDMNTVVAKNGDILSFQKRLWPYNFKIVPIELISSIYEMFAHSKDPIDARAKSIHYTKVQVVELILSLAMKDLSDDACVLDPTCGSGVFLVDAFRRLIWKKRSRLNRNLTHNEIMDILLNQIYGIDIEKGAIEVTAFSLYLTLLEFDEDILLNMKDKLPNLIYNTSWDEKYSPSLYIQDICNTNHEFNKYPPFVNKKFDLIVGNLPWTELNKKTAPYDPDNPESGKQWILEYINKNKIPSNNTDQAIMNRVRDFSNKDTIIALIIHSRIFYQSGLKKYSNWFQSFISKNNIYLVINLSDLRDDKILFGGKKQKGVEMSPGSPGSIIYFKPHPPNRQSSVLYICPKWYRSIKKRGDILIHPSDAHELSTELLKENPDLWKIAFRGTYKDFELLSRLSKKPYRSLKDLLHGIGIDDELYGRGYEIGNKNKSSSQYFGLPNLESKNEAGKRYKNKYILSESDKLPKFRYEKLERPRNINMFKGPLLLFRRSLLDDGETIVFFTSKDIVVYDCSYFGISFKGADERYAHRMNAIFNSKLPLYFAFMLGSEFAWYRRLIDDRDWLRMPLPNSILDLNDKRWNTIEDLEKKLISKWSNNGTNSKEMTEIEDLLFKKILEVYELTEDEQIIIKDTINYDIRLFIKRHARKKEERRNAINEITGAPSLTQLQKYADKFSNQLNFILAYEDKKVIYRLYDIGSFSPLNVLEFEQLQKRDKRGNKKKKIEGIEDILSHISNNLRNEISDNIYTWGYLRIYEKNQVFIIKPNEKRFWTESSALNDVYNIVQEHMRLNSYEQPKIISSSW